MCLLLKKSFTHEKTIICRIEWREAKPRELLFWTKLSVVKKAKMVEE